MVGRQLVLVVGVVVALPFGCRERRQEVNVERTTTQEDEATRAQKSSEQALDEARKAQERATEQQDEVARAQRVVAERTAAAQKSETELARERQEAQTAQQAAQAKTEEANRTAQEAQQRALSAQRAATEAARTAERTATTATAGATTAEGTVTAIDPERLVLDRATGPDLHIKVTPAVPVTGAKGTAGEAAATLEDVAIGSNVRVRYHLEANQPVAERIEIASAGGTVR